MLTEAEIGLHVIKHRPAHWYWLIACLKHAHAASQLGYMPIFWLAHSSRSILCVCEQ